MRRERRILTLHTNIGLLESVLMTVPWVKEV
jgi:hypothetical protein